MIVIEHSVILMSYEFQSPIYKIHKTSESLESPQQQQQQQKSTSYGLK